MNKIRKNIAIICLAGAGIFSACDQSKNGSESKDSNVGQNGASNINETISASSEQSDSIPKNNESQKDLPPPSPSGTSMNQNSQSSNESQTVSPDDKKDADASDESPASETDGEKRENPEVTDNSDASSPEDGKDKKNEELVSLSFKGANIDTIIQWLSKTTGKSIIKHPQANCKITIVSVDKLSKPEALDLLYHALSLEGVTTTENGKTIVIHPENVDAKVQPELLEDSDSEYPNGWRPVMRVFELKNVQASEMDKKIKDLLSKNAKVQSDEAGNKLIVTDYAENIELLDRLLTSLDVEQSEDYTVRSIPINNVDAEDLDDEISDLFRNKSRNGGLSVDITANQRSNSLIVMSSAADFKSIQDLVKSLDTEDAQKTVLRQFQLVNADAQEVATQLETLYTNQSGRDRYNYYSYKRRSSDQSVNFVADTRRNILLVQGPPSSMEQIGELIKTLDEPISEDSLTPQIFQLEYVSAVDMEEVLNELFNESTGQRNYWDPWDNRRNNSSNTNTGRLLGKVKITAEPYSNSIIVSSNSPENTAAVVDVLKTLDIPSQAGETTLRVPLNFAEAVKVANSVNVLFAKAGSPASQANTQNNRQNQNNQNNNQNNNQSNTPSFELEREIEEKAYYPWLGGQQDNNRFGTSLSRPVSELVGRVRIVPDPRTNSLLVTSNMNFFPEVLKLVKELDAPTPQVLIEVRILEVSTDLRDRIGTRFTSGSANTFESDDFEGSFIGAATGGIGDTFSNIFGSDTSSGVIDASVDVNLLVQFLKKNADATVLAEPQINVADNELGRLFVGSKIPFIQGSLNTREGGRNDTFQYRDVGIILELTPQINNDKEVALKIRVESSNMRAGETLLGGAILDTRSFRTDLLVRDQQTVVLGGIIQKEESETVRKIPLLGDIPVLGYAFKKKDKVVSDVELMVFLTPRITRTLNDVESLTENVESKTPKIKAWRESNERM